MPITRAERVATHQSLIFSRHTDKQREFLDFVLRQYVREGVGELDQAKLPQLLELHYDGVTEAVATLGSVPTISALFSGFQKYLYESEPAA